MSKIDNKPENARKSELESEFDKIKACIHCGYCLPACPTYLVTGSEAESPRGRLYLMNGYYQGEITASELKPHLDACLGCMGCVTACPSGVDYGHVLHETRKELLPLVNPFKRLFRRFAYRYILPTPWVLNCIVSGVNGLNSLGIINALRNWPFLGFLGLLPKIKPAPKLEAGMKFGQNRHGRVAFLTGCVMNAAFRQTNHNTIKVLVHNGYEVVIPEQTCCGALPHHAGETDISEELALKNIQSVLLVNPDWIVTNAAGCGSTLKEYGEVIPDNPDSRMFSQKTMDILQLLAQKPLEGALKPVNQSVAYHAACHLHHAQGIQSQPYDVLKQLPGVKLIPLNNAELCCGSAGVYNIAEPELSHNILNQRMEGLRAASPDCLVVSNPGCLLQFQKGLQEARMRLNVLHPIDLIAQAYD